MKNPFSPRIMRPIWWLVIGLCGVGYAMLLWDWPK